MRPNEVCGAAIRQVPQHVAARFRMRPNNLREERRLELFALVKAWMAHLEAGAMATSQALSTDDRGRMVQ